MNNPEIVKLLIRKDERIANLQRQLDSIKDKVNRDYIAWNSQPLEKSEETKAFIRGNVRALKEIKDWIENTIK